MYRLGTHLPSAGPRPAQRPLSRQRAPRRPWTPTAPRHSESELRGQVDAVAAAHLAYGSPSQSPASVAVHDRFCQYFKSYLVRT